MAQKLREAGIYEIRNIVNQKHYIGSAMCFTTRKSQHWKALKAGTHHSRYLQRAWDLYGEDAFVFTIREYIPNPAREILAAREQHYLNTERPEYNMLATAGSLLGHRWTTEQREQHRTTQREAQSRPDVILRKRAAAKTAMNRPDVKQRMVEAINQPDVSRRKRAALLQPDANRNNRLAIKTALSQPEIKQRQCVSVAASLRKVESRRKQYVGYLQRYERMGWMKAAENCRAKIAALDELIAHGETLVPPFAFRSPEGVPFTDIANLRAFCRQQNLNDDYMLRVYYGTALQHKGWTKL